MAMAIRRLLSDYITDIRTALEKWLSGCWNGQCNSHPYIFSGADLSGGEYAVYDDASAVFEEGTNYDYFGQTITGSDIDGDGSDELFVAALLGMMKMKWCGCVLLYRVLKTSLQTETTRGNRRHRFHLIMIMVIRGETEDAIGETRCSIADFNGDTVPDLAVAGANANQVFIFFDAESFSVEKPMQIPMQSLLHRDPDGYALAAGDMNGDD